MTPSVAEIEAAGFATWSADVTAAIDGWTVRSNGGFTRRVNSATVVGSAETGIDTRDRLAEWLEHRSAGLAVRIKPLLADETASAVRQGRGLIERDETRVLASPCREAGTSVDDPRFDLVEPSNERFTLDLERLNARSDASSGAWRRLLGRLGEAVGVWIPGIAVALAARHHDVVMVYSVAVAESERRSGLGTAAMQVAASWAADTGASWCALQVEGSNAAAGSLYDALGYAEVYRYSYLQPNP